MTAYNVGDNVVYHGRQATVRSTHRDDDYILLQYTNPEIAREHGWNISYVSKEHGNVAPGDGYWYVRRGDGNLSKAPNPVEFNIGCAVKCITDDRSYVTKNRVYTVADVKPNKIRLAADDEGDDFVWFHQGDFELVLPVESGALIYVQDAIRELHGISSRTTYQTGKLHAYTNVLEKFGYSYREVVKPVELEFYSK